MRSNWSSERRGLDYERMASSIYRLSESGKSFYNINVAGYSVMDHPTDGFILVIKRR